MAETVLQSRLKNCLQTILELEPALERLAVHHEMESELVKLKAFMQRVEHMELRENSVHHIEEATKTFLEGMRLPIMSLNAKLSHVELKTETASAALSGHEHKRSNTWLLQ